VHVFVAGQIVEEGGAELAEELETSGYERFLGVDGSAAATSVNASTACATA
jgi:Fe-S cluster assembly ATP-binding protein